MNWSNWSTGDTHWKFGALVPDDVLYEDMGPAVFTAKVGLQSFLFYKSSEHKKGDYYIAVETQPNVIAAMKAGRLSVRGALSQPYCWLVDVDLDLEVKRFEQVPIDAVAGLIPKSGIPLLSHMGVTVDSVQQADSVLAFKFIGDELKDGLISLGVFKNLVATTYDVVRDLFVPPALRASNAADLLEFPMRQPVLASLLIAIEHPSIDVSRMRRRQSTKSLNAGELEQQAEQEGAKFVEGVERTVERASSGREMQTFARENFDLFDRLSEVVPGERGEVSKLQLSSRLIGSSTFIELDRDIGERIRHAYKAVRDSSINIEGIVAGTINKSNLLILRPDRGQDITCYLVPPIFKDLLARGELNSGKRLLVSGSFQKRVRRNLMQVKQVRSI